MRSKPPPKAPKGNKLALKHGAHAEPPPSKAAAMRDAIFTALAASAPVRQGDALPPADDAAVKLCALTLCRLQSVSEWIDVHGPLDAKGRPRSAALWERRLTATATKQLAALGMTPQARARIGVDVSQVIDLASALSEPDERKRAALMQQAGLDVPSPPTGGQTLQE